MYTLTIDVNGKVGQEKIDRLIRIHQTPQDPVVVVYTDTKLPDGYTISKFDGLVSHYVKANPEEAKQKTVQKALHEQNERISKEKFFNK
jgi:hypothetical protein